MAASTWATILAALLGGGLVQLIITFATRKKTDAEATDFITTAATNIVDRLEKEALHLHDEMRIVREQLTKQDAKLDAQNLKIQEQSTKISEQNQEIRSLRNEVSILRREVSRRGGDPDAVLQTGGM